MEERLDEYIREFEQLRDSIETQLPAAIATSDVKFWRCKLNELSMTVAVIGTLKKLRRDAPAKQASFWLKDTVDSVRKVVDKK